jgi:TrmH family RNA methyltransferase
MERIADTVAPQAICAVVAEPETTIDSILTVAAHHDGRATLVFVCVDVRDPGNLGALIRSSAAAGAAGIVCCAGTVDLYNPKVIRSSAGALFGHCVAREASVHTALDLLEAAGFRLIATVAEGGDDYVFASLTGRMAVLLGNEASGLPAELVGRCSSALHIPMAESTESLNVAMTGTVLAFDIARRQREAAPWPKAASTS